MCTLNDVAQSAAKILRTGGRLYIIYRTERLAELLVCLSQNKLEPKKLRLVAQRFGSAPNFVLVEARKGAKQGTEVMPTLYVYKDGAGYTDEVKRIYNIEEKE